MKRSFLLLAFALHCAHSAIWNKSLMKWEAANVNSAPSVVPNLRTSTQHVSRSGGWNNNFNFRMNRGVSYRQAGNQNKFESEELVNGIPYGKSGYRGSARLYTIQVESGASFLNVMCNGGNGDVDIYVRFNDYPTKSQFDERSAHTGNQEQVIIQKPRVGRYYIVLYGYNSYETVGFEAEFR